MSVANNFHHHIHHFVPRLSCVYVALAFAEDRYVRLASCDHYERMIFVSVSPKKSSPSHLSNTSDKNRRVILVMAMVISSEAEALEWTVDIHGLLLVRKEANILDAVIAYEVSFCCLEHLTQYSRPASHSDGNSMSWFRN